MTVSRVSKYAMQIDNGPGRSTLFLIQSGTGKVSVNISGPLGGNQQALVVSADDLLGALEELGVISKVTALVLAAPALLEALEALLRVYHDTNVNYRHEHERTVAERAHAIIAKAKGQGQ